MPIEANLCILFRCAFKHSTLELLISLSPSLYLFHCIQGCIADGRFFKSPRRRERNRRGEAARIPGAPFSRPRKSLEALALDLGFLADHGRTTFAPVNYSAGNLAR